MAYQYQLSLS